MPSEFGNIATRNANIGSTTTRNAGGLDFPSLRAGKDKTTSVL
jgi:hypothetical protein